MHADCASPCQPTSNLGLAQLSKILFVCITLLWARACSDLAYIFLGCLTLYHLQLVFITLPRNASLNYKQAANAHFRARVQALIGLNFFWVG
jgi:hypothetical protein